MRKFGFPVMALLAFVFLAGTSMAQRGGGKGKGDEAAGPRLKQMTVIITEVGEASIAYVEEGKPVRMSRGRISSEMVGVADVTRVVKPEWKPVDIKALEKGDRAILTVYEDPEDPYFPALTVKVIGKGEIKTDDGGRSGGGRSGGSRSGGSRSGGSRSGGGGGSRR